MTLPRRALMRRFVVCRAVPFVVPFLVATGCAHAQKPAPLAAPAQAPFTRGGVTYDRAPPLDAVVTPRFKADDPPAESKVYAVTFRGANKATVPGLFVVPAQAAKPSPCVILLHGLGGNKSQMALVATALAHRGYASLSIDIAGHGDRPRIGGKSITEASIEQMHLAAAQTIADLRRATDFLAARPDVDSKRIGYLGASLGGIIGTVFAGDEPRIKAVALWAAGGDWGKLFTRSSISTPKGYDKNLSARDAEAARIEAIMRDVDPLTNVAQIAPRPLLLINGDQDTVVPPVCTDELVAAARDPKKRVTLPGGHIPDPLGMMAQTIAWFDANLR